MSQGPAPNRIIYCATTAFTPTYMADLTTQDRMLGHASAAMTLDTYTHLWETGIDTIPYAVAEHMAAERKREADRAARRAKRRGRGLRIVDG